MERFRGDCDKLSGMRHLRTFIFATSLLTFSTTSASAERNTFENPENPSFRAAVAAWLDDDDTSSLPALSVLARSGIQAAGLLLDRIEATDRAYSDYVWSLTRDQRLEIYRPSSANGIFQPGWIETWAGRGSAFAQSLDASLRYGVNLAGLRKLTNLGETHATEHLVRKIGVDGTQDDRRAAARIIGPDAENAPFLLAFLAGNQSETTGRNALAVMTGQPVSAFDKETTIAAEFADIGFQAGSANVPFKSSNRYYASVARWVLSAPAPKPMGDLCRRHCQEDQRRACAVTALGLVGGYYEAIRFDSPLEAIIPQTTFAESRRARNMALRQMRAAITEAGDDALPEDELKGRSLCLAAALEKLKKPD